MPRGGRSNGIMDIGHEKFEHWEWKSAFVGTSERRARCLGFEECAQRTARLI